MFEGSPEREKLKDELIPSCRKVNQGWVKPIYRSDTDQNT